MIGMLYHPAHREQAEVVSTYYQKHGYMVYTREADFKVKPEHECRNEFFALHPEMQFMLVIDSDEIILPADMEKIISAVKENHIVRANIIDYVEEQCVIDPLRPHKPVVAVQRGVEFYNNRNVEGKGIVLDVNVHHLGYLSSVLDWKIRNYIARNELHELGNCQMIRNSDYQVYDTPEEVLDIMGALS
jgi:hypothetical protein